MSIISIDSEIGRLEGVVLFKPGNEVERMTPDNAKEALYGDILNKEILQKEYGHFYDVLSKWTTVYEIHDLLEKMISSSDVHRFQLIEKSCKMDKCTFIIDTLSVLPSKELAKVLIEGYEFNPETHPKEYKKERFCLKPLYNFFYTRDTSSTIFDSVLINPMATPIRNRERYIMRSIFEYHFNAKTISPLTFDKSALTEGGDILIARNDTILVGNGKRTNKKGIEFLTNHLIKKGGKFNILVQELPDKESFIHLDMVFTFLDKGTCMIYEPLIKKLPSYSTFHTTHISIDNGKVQMHEKNNFLHGLKDLGFDMEPICCGGTDEWFQSREQYHSGANFFALDEGKIIGYDRNKYTIEALSNAGFSIIPAKEFSPEKLNNAKRAVVTLKACELPRGGGGARCMTMPIKRAAVKW